MLKRALHFARLHELSVLTFHLFLLKSCADCLALLLVTGLVEQCEHVLLVCLYTWLVEWVHAKYITADTAANLKEVEKLADVVCVELRD